MQSGTVFYILSLYMPSQGGSEDLETSLDEFSEIIDTIEGNSLCILCGDFNGDMGALGGFWSDRVVTQLSILVARFLKKHNSGGT